jgi:hypothetical protein
MLEAIEYGTSWRLRVRSDPISDQELAVLRGALPL